MPNAAAFLSLLESQDIYYHVTGALRKILSQNQFILTNGVTKATEIIGGGMKRPFFLSMSRVRANRYRYGSQLLVLDGQKLGQRYKIVPFEYWGAEMGRVTGSSEAEDRLLSPEPVIPNAKDYILEIHILADQFKWDSKETMPDLGDLAWLASDIPVHIYRDRKAFMLLDKRKAENIDLSELPSGSSHGRERYTIEYERLLDFLETGRDPEQRWRQYLTYPGDFMGQISTFLHNATSQKELADVTQHRRLVAMMRRDGATGMHDFLMGRFRALRKVTPEEFPDSYFQRY